MTAKRNLFDPSAPLSSSSIAKSWCAVAAATIPAIAFSIIWVDHRLAPHFLRYYDRFDIARAGFDSPIIVSAELVVLVIMSFMRLAGGTVATAARALTVAICASLAAFAVNDYALKTVFGR